MSAHSSIKRRSSRRASLLSQSLRGMPELPPLAWLRSSSRIRRNRITSLLTAGAVLAVLLLLAALATGPRAIERTTRWYVEPRDMTEPGKVTVWHPRTDAPCAASSLEAPAAKHSPDNFPYAIVREAAADYRYASRREFSSLNPDIPVFLRVVLYITVHLSVVIHNPDTVTDNSSISPHVRVNAPVTIMDDRCTGSSPLIASNDFAAEILGRVDHVIEVNSFVRHRGTYTPGQTTVYGQEVTEWQVIISLVPAECSSISTDEEFRQRLNALDAGGARLNINLPLQRFDSAMIPFNISMTLGCITGWENPDTFPRLYQFLQRTSCRHGARGAVALAGSGLHGTNRLHARHVRQVAHFAARALMGRIQFDAVAVPVIVNRTLSEASENCGNDVQCLQEFHADNEEFLNGIASVVEEELDVLGLAKSDYGKIIILPMCRLGSHHVGSEKNAPCSSSFWWGQYHATYFGYNLVGSYYRWAASLDIDEYLSPSDGISIFRARYQQAEGVFDRINRRRHNAIKFTWLNFRISHVNHSRDLSQAILSLKMPTLRDPSHPRTRCYDFPHKDKNGKAALKCDNGLGFTIHSAVQAPRNGRLDQWTRRTPLLNRKIRTWHPRLKGSLGRCDYVPV